MTVTLGMLWVGHMGQLVAQVLLLAGRKGGPQLVVDLPVGFVEGGGGKVLQGLECKQDGGDLFVPEIHRDGQGVGQQPVAAQPAGFCIERSPQGLQFGDIPEGRAFGDGELLHQVPQLEGLPVLEKNQFLIEPFRFLHKNPSFL